MTVTSPLARRTEFLSFSPPLIGAEEIDEVVDTLRSNWITTGPKTKRFETEFAAALGAPGALALNSCTAALHTALVTAGIGPGDEVVTTPMTFVASVNVIEHVGARPVLADVEPSSASSRTATSGARSTSFPSTCIPTTATATPTVPSASRSLTRIIAACSACR